MHAVAASGHLVEAAPCERRLRAGERHENFPVALALLPRSVKRDLRAIYRVVRTIDDIGDAPEVSPGDRLARLDELEADLDRLWRGDQPTLDVVRRLRRTVVERRLPAEPFLALVDANRLDQTTQRYPTFDDLQHYCALSAEPIGRLVLALAGAATPGNVALSNRVCTALQILEHCQDVAEDRRDRDRVYLPIEDMAAYGVTVDDLDDAHANAEVRRLVRFEVDRATALLAHGAPLVERMRGWSRLAVAGYVAGGRATVDAIRRADFDVLVSTPRPRRRDVVRHLVALLVRPR